MTELLDVYFDFDEVGKIIKVNWSNGTWDEWTYHFLIKQELKLAAAKKLSKIVINKVGKENMKNQSDGKIFKMIYSDDGIFLLEKFQQ
jgi:hypothetical protein